jgi:hypothetical protein
MPRYPLDDEQKLQASRPPSIHERFPNIAPPSLEEEAILGALADVESSGGVDTNHKEIRSPDSIHAGDSAIGTYALMPNTLELVRNRAVRDNQISPAFADLIGLQSNELAERVKQDPELEKEFATRYLRSLPPETTPEQKQYLWQFGDKADLEKQAERQDPNRAIKFQESLKKRFGKRTDT